MRSQHGGGSYWVDRSQAWATFGSNGPYAQPPWGPVPQFLIHGTIYILVPLNFSVKPVCQCGPPNLITVIAPCNGPRIQLARATFTRWGRIARPTFGTFRRLWFSIQPFSSENQNKTAAKISEKSKNHAPAKTK
jgi:hypothetical protein